MWDQGTGTQRLWAWVIVAGSTFGVVLRASGHEGWRLGPTAQPARLPTIAANSHAVQADGHRIKRNMFMGLILLEALLALVVLIAIVWWTMFAGRSKGELSVPADDADQDKP
jgi:hypothetical protein